jgi:tetratricopeptide (TPR) repeat protein
LAVAALDATAVPEQVMPLLATTLSDLAANLAESRETAEGAEVAARAVEVWRRVRQIESAIGVNIVSALLNLAECLRAEARYEEALGANAEATRILREEAPGAAAPMLGDLAWQRAKCHTEVGDHRSAVEARLEECKIRRPLAQSDRTQQLRLARCYTELATGYKALEQPLIALDAAGTAAGIYYDLFGPAPGSNGPEVARALAMMGDAFCRVGQPAKAVASFLNAISMAHEAGDVEFAQAMGAALNIARAMDPVGVQAELDLLLGPDH